MEVFKLFGSIFVNTSDAENSISKTAEKAEGFGSKLKSGMKTALKWGTVIAGACATAGGAMMAMAKNSADALGDIDDAAQRIGVDAETMQELKYVAEMSGMAMSDLEKAAKKLKGTDLNLDDAINQIMSLGTAEEQTQMAIDIFGESVAYKLQPLLNQGADGIEAFKEQARELGVVISNDTVEAGASFGDMYDAVTNAIDSMKNQLSADLMPYLSEILQWVLDNIPAMKETIKTIVEAIVPIVKNVLDIIMKALPPVMALIKQILDWIMPYLEPILQAVGEVIEALFNLIKGDFKGFANAIENLLKTLATSLYGIGKDIMTSLWNGLKFVWNKLSSWFSDKIQSIKDKLSNVISIGNNAGTSGTHASGLPYVPYDGYTAVLHKGETILNANDSKNMVSDIVNALVPFMGGGGEKTFQIQVSGKTLAEVIYDPLQDVTRQKGVVYG